jgi:hypothetical protein
MVLVTQRLPIIIMRAGGQEGVCKVRDAFGGVVATRRGEVADGRTFKSLCSLVAEA